MENIFLAHILGIASKSTDSLSVGTPKTALIFALLLSAAILFFYLVMDRLPKNKKSKITAKNEPKFIKTMIGFATGTMLAAGFDAWWHVAVGRESFFVPPHIFLYGFSTAGIVLSFYIWLQTRDSHWKHTLFTLLIIPLAGAFDNFWHTIFGAENLANPKMMPWSPPHLLLMIAGLLILIHLLIALLKYRKTEDFSFFGNLAMGIIAILLLAIAMPFHPTELWGQVAGFAGAGVISVIFIGSALAAQRIMKGRIDATLMTMFMLMVYLTMYGKEVASQVLVLPHDRAPNWLIIFSYLVVAALLDLTKNHFAVWLRGLLAGALWGGMLFGFSTQFFAPQFQYGTYEIIAAITFAGLGGLVAASLFGLTHLFDEEHIAKLLKKF